MTNSRLTVAERRRSRVRRPTSPRRVRHRFRRRVAPFLAAVSTLVACTDDTTTRSPSSETLPRAEGRHVAASAFDHLHILVPEAQSISVELDGGSAHDAGRRGGTVDIRQRGTGFALSRNADGVTAAVTLIDITAVDAEAGETTITRLLLTTTRGGERHTETTDIDTAHDLLDAWWTGDEIGVVTRDPNHDEVVLRTYLSDDGLRLRTRLELPLTDRVELGNGPGMAVEIPPRAEVPVTLTAAGNLTVRVLDDSVVTLVDPDGRLAFDTNTSDAIVAAESQRPGNYIARVTPRSNGRDADDPVIATITFGAAIDASANR